jgi:Kef-type K+ transport system membrane component KefB
MSYLEIFVEVAIALALILAACQIVGSLARYISQPRVVGEMIAGVLLGPTLFGKLFPDLYAMVFPLEVMPFLFVIANIGLSIYMFIVGTEINISLFNKKLMKDAGVISAGAIIVPFICGYFSMILFSDLLNTYELSPFGFTIFMGTAFAITAFPMLARILQENQIIQTRIGGLAMVSASIQDVVSWILLGLVTALAVGDNFYSVIFMIAGATALVLFLFYVINPLLAYWFKRKGVQQLDNSIFSVVLFLLIGCAVFTDYLGLYSVFGGFMLGLSMPRQKHLLLGISMRIKDITVVLFLPVFFAFSGLNTDLSVLTEPGIIGPSLIILLFAFASKLIPLFGLMQFQGYSNRDSFSIASLMNSRGLMELIIANIGLMYGLIDHTLYAILVIVAIVTTLSAMPLYNLSQKASDK